MINTRIRLVTSIASIVLLFFATCFTVSGQEIPTDPANVQAGKQLFDANCRSCHRVQQKLVGPALAGVYDRAPSIQWIIDFVHNSSAVIASGDPYAVQLYNEYNKTQMTAFTSLTEEQILDILAYVKAEAEAPPPAPTEAQPGAGQQVAEQGIPSQYLNAILIGMVLILVLLVVILGFLISAIKRLLDQKELSEEDKEVVHSPISTGSIVRSKGFIFLVMFVVVALGFKAVINGLYSVGIQQGYAPTQPIAFSHRIHAGVYEIDCKYCHSSAMVSKNAGIPSLNVCMNCHNQIKEGAVTGTAEIANLVNAYSNGEPIEWVRIHNLPDLAYFNHSQHVNVGAIECQTCHGPVQEMDVVRQVSPLTMGWCIDCHRQTEVVTDNDYYDKLVELHSKKEPITVKDIGGLECSKCHY